MAKKVFTFTLDNIEHDAWRIMRIIGEFVNGFEESASSPPVKFAFFFDIVFSFTPSLRSTLSKPSLAPIK